VNTKVRDTLLKYQMIPENSTILIALSGGADSMVLLDFLRCEGEALSIKKLMACHINHKIRQDADENEEFVKDYCQRTNIPFFTRQVNIPLLSKETGESEELCGRRIRYEILEELAQKHEALIATAHNLSDHAETVVFNLTRGSGLKGLCGIPPVRGNVIRPLIDVSKDEILDYCKEHNILYFTDSTNEDTRYTRNKIRHTVIPVLKEINPSFEQITAQMSRQIREEEAFLEQLTEEAYVRVQIPNGIDIPKLLRENHVVVRRILKNQLINHGIEPSFKTIDGIFSRLTEPFFDITLSKDIHILLKNNVLSFKNPQIIKDTIRPSKNVSLHEIKNLEKINKNLLNNIIDCDKIIGKILISSRREGDFFTLPKRNVTKSLKKLFNEASIPAEARSSAVVLRDDAGVVWVEGFGADKRAAAGQDTKKAMEVIVSVHS